MAVKSGKIVPVRRVPASPEGAKARAIAATRPASAKATGGAKKAKAGTKKPLAGTKKPLAPERVAAILDVLAKTYPGVVCALNHSSAWELTVATILSAQCTDARVNMVTPELFQALPYTEGDGGGFPARA